MIKNIHLHSKEFEPYISEDAILASVKEVALKINAQYTLFACVLAAWWSPLQPSGRKVS